MCFSKTAIRPAVDCGAPPLSSLPKPLFMSDEPPTTGSPSAASASEIFTSRDSGARLRGNRRRGKRSRESRPVTGGRVLKWILVSGVVGLMALVAALFGAKYWLEGWLKGEGFRKKIELKLAETLRSQVSLAQPEWEGRRIFIAQAKTEGYEDAPLARIDLNQVRLQFGGIEQGALKVPEIVAGRATVEFSRDRLEGAYQAPTRAEGAAAGSGGELPTWLRRWIPERTELGSVRLDSGDLVVKTATGEEALGLRAVRVTGTPVDAADPSMGWMLNGQGGQLNLIKQPPMTVDQFLLRWKGDDLRLQEAKVQVYDSARVSGAGDIFLGDSPMVDLDLRVENLDPKNLLGPGSARKVSGTLAGGFKVTGVPGRGESFKAEGTLKLANGVIENVPQLDKIATYTKSPQFKRLVLSEATVDFLKQGDTTTLPRIAMQSDGLMRIEGSLTIQGQAIAGDLQVGLAPGTLGWIPGAERKVFNQQRDGFLWTSVKVSGTTDDIREDLTGRLVTAAVESLVEETPDKAIDTAKELLKDPETSGKIINEGLKLLDGFLNKK